MGKKFRPIANGRSFSLMSGSSDRWPTVQRFHRSIHLSFSFRLRAILINILCFAVMPPVVSFNLIVEPAILKVGQIANPSTPLFPFFLTKIKVPLHITIVIKPKLRPCTA